MADEQDDLILEPAAKRTRIDDAVDTSQQAGTRTASFNNSNGDNFAALV